MTRVRLPVIVFAAVVLGAGALHGSFTGRWHTSAELGDALDRLNNVPLALGDWRGERQYDLDEAELRRGGIKGHFKGRFKDTATGETISLLIVCGRPGPISVHTPDICYGSAGYTGVNNPRQKDLTVDQGNPLSVWAMRFKAPATSGASPIEVNWAWIAGDRWKAPNNPRWTFASEPVLFKLYVVRNVPLSDADKKKDRDPTIAFLQLFLPELEKTLARKS